jgi:hypothetical protein
MVMSAFVYALHLRSRKCCSTTVSSIRARGTILWHVALSIVLLWRQHRTSQRQSSHQGQAAIGHGSRILTYWQVPPLELLELELATQAVPAELTL